MVTTTKKVIVGVIALFVVLGIIGAATGKKATTAAKTATTNTAASSPASHERPSTTSPTVASPSADFVGAASPFSGWIMPITRDPAIASAIVASLEAKGDESALRTWLEKLSADAVDPDTRVASLLRAAELAERTASGGDEAVRLYLLAREARPDERLVTERLLRLGARATVPADEGSPPVPALMAAVRSLDTGRETDRTTAETLLSSVRRDIARDAARIRGLEPAVLDPHDPPVAVDRVRVHEAPERERVHPRVDGAQERLGHRERRLERRGPRGVAEAPAVVERPDLGGPEGLPPRPAVASDLRGVLVDRVTDGRRHLAVRRVPGQVVEAQPVVVDRVGVHEGVDVDASRRHLEDRIDLLLHADELARLLQAIEELRERAVGHGARSLQLRPAGFNVR